LAVLQATSNSGTRNVIVEIADPEDVPQEARSHMEWDFLGVRFAVRRENLCT
jgi:hypothetical protein